MDFFDLLFFLIGAILMVCSAAFKDMTGKH